MPLCKQIALRLLCVVTTSVLLPVMPPGCLSSSPSTPIRMGHQGALPDKTPFRVFDGSLVGGWAHGGPWLGRVRVRDRARSHDRVLGLAWPVQRALDLQNDMRLMGMPGGVSCILGYHSGSPPGCDPVIILGLLALVRL